MENYKVNDEDVTLFTDGSKIDATGAGWAVTHKDDVIAEESVYLGKIATVFQAEVIAITRGLQWVHDSMDPGLNIIVKSDSQAAIGAIFQRQVVSKTVAECRSTLLETRKNHKVSIEWVKGHADVTGNELADSLAKTGSEMIGVTCEPVVPVPPSEIKQWIKHKFINAWQSHWISTSDCQKTKMFIPQVGVTNIREMVNKTKSQLNLIVQVCTGHALVANHIRHWVDIQDICKLCQAEKESTAHLFFDCPTLWELRRDIDSHVKNLKNKITAFFEETSLQSLFRDRSHLCEGRLVG